MCNYCESCLCAACVQGCQCPFFCIKVVTHSTRFPHGVSGSLSDIHTRTQAGGDDSSTALPLLLDCFSSQRLPPQCCTSKCGATDSGESSALSQQQGPLHFLPPQARDFFRCAGCVCLRSVCDPCSLSYKETCVCHFLFISHAKQPSHNVPFLLFAFRLPSSSSSADFGGAAVPSKAAVKQGA